MRQHQQHDRHEAGQRQRDHCDRKDMDQLHLAGTPEVKTKAAAGPCPRELRAFYHNGSARASGPGQKRRPDGLADVAALGAQLLLVTAVGRHDRERAAASLFGAVNQRSAVRREARRLVLLRRAQHAQCARLEIHRRDAIGAAVERDHRELRAVRRHPRPRVVAAFERDSLRAAARIEPDLVDLRSAGTIGREIDRAPVERPGGLGVDGVVRGDALQRLARKIERVDVEIGIP